MDSISIIRTPIESELEAFKELYDSSLSSSNTLLDSVVAHIRQRSGKMMRPILVLLVARLLWRRVSCHSSCGGISGTSS